MARLRSIADWFTFSLGASCASQWSEVCRIGCTLRQRFALLAATYRAVVQLTALWLYADCSVAWICKECKGDVRQYQQGAWQAETVCGTLHLCDVKRALTSPLAARVPLPAPGRATQRPAAAAAQGRTPAWRACSATQRCSVRATSATVRRSMPICKTGAISAPRNSSTKQRVIWTQRCG